jgi:copper resistance protein D
MAGIVLLGLLGVLATTTGEAMGVAANAWSPAAWFGIVQQTWVGRMWPAQALLATGYWLLSYFGVYCIHDVCIAHACIMLYVPLPRSFL